MGCCSSSTARQEQIDIKVLAEFLHDPRNLRQIWDHFNKNNDDALDKKEFDNLLYIALTIFTGTEEKGDPNRKSRKEMQPQIDKLHATLAPRIDTNGDGVITFDEFQRFGDFMIEQYEKLQ